MKLYHRKFNVLILFFFALFFSCSIYAEEIKQPVLIKKCLDDNQDFQDTLGKLTWKDNNKKRMVNYEEKMSKCILNNIFKEFSKVTLKTKRNIIIEGSSERMQGIPSTAATITEPVTSQGGSFSDKAVYALYSSANEKAKEELNAYLMSLFIGKICDGDENGARKMSLRYTCQALDPNSDNLLNPNIYLLKNSIKKDILSYPFQVMVYDCIHDYGSAAKLPGCSDVNEKTEESTTKAMRIIYEYSYIPYFSALIGIVENISDTSQLYNEFEHINPDFTIDIVEYAKSLNKNRTLTKKQLVSIFIGQLAERVRLSSEWNSIINAIPTKCAYLGIKAIDPCLNELFLNHEQYPLLAGKTIAKINNFENINKKVIDSVKDNLNELNTALVMYGHFSDGNYQEALNYGIREYSENGNMQNYTNSLFWVAELANSNDYQEIQTKLNDLFSDHGTYTDLGKKGHYTKGVFAGLGYSYLNGNTDESSFSTKVGFRYSFGRGGCYHGPRLTIFDFTGSFSSDDSAPEDLEGFAKSSLSPSLDYEIQLFENTPLNFVVGVGTRRLYNSDTNLREERENFWRFSLEFTTNLLSF